SGKRFTCDSPMQHQCVTHGKIGPVRLRVNVADGEILQIKLLETIEVCLACFAAGIGKRHERLRYVLLNFDPVLVFDVFPEKLFQLLAAGGIGPMGNRVLSPYSAAHKQSDEKQYRAEPARNVL